MSEPVVPPPLPFDAKPKRSGGPVVPIFYMVLCFIGIKIFTSILVPGRRAALHSYRDAEINRLMASVPAVPETAPAQPMPTPLPPSPESVLAWQQEAMRQFPELAKSGSPLNSAFLAEHARLRSHNPDFFLVAGWPLILASKCDGELKSQPISSARR